MNELLRLLQNYLADAKGLGECAEWLAGVVWDDPDLTNEEKESLGLFELLLTEISEGFREEQEFWDAAADFVASKSDIVYGRMSAPKVSTAVSTTSTSSLLQELVVIGDSGSLSGSISPPEVLS